MFFTLLVLYTHACVLVRDILSTKFSPWSVSMRVIHECTCVYIHVHMHACMHVCVIHECTCVYIHIHTHVCMCVLYKNAHVS
jgi:hypothetical protein